MPIAFAAEAPVREVAATMTTFDMVANASFIVQLVLLCLVSFSVITWAIIFSKWKLMKNSLNHSESFLDVFWSGKSMDFIYSESKRYAQAPIAKIFQSGYVELQRLMEKDRQRSEKGASTSDSSIQNLERALNRANRNETARLERSLSFLASAASTAPFIGLFGTVWGIMNAFQNIGAQGSASLATVAPGIAEALIATAVGLACAIPASMGYNYYIQRVRSLRTQMENFSGDFLNIVKRNFLAG